MHDNKKNACMIATIAHLCGKLQVFIYKLFREFFEIGFSQYNMTHYLNLSNLSVEKNRLFFFGFHNLP